MAIQISLILKTNKYKKVVKKKKRWPESGMDE